MAKKNQVYIDIVVDDSGTTKRVAVNAKKLGIELDKAGAASDKTSKNTDKLSKSNKDLDRNLRGAANMTSNSTKEFSKMQQGMGGLVMAYATLAAQVFAVSAAFQFLQSASDFRNLIAGQEALGAISGVTYKTITAGIIEATDAQIKYSDAAKAAAIGTAAGLTTSQLTDLGAAAKNVSFALGRDLTDSFNRLVRGVTKAEPELLDELGIILRLDPAVKKYAAEIGKSASELDAFERSQAVTNDVLDQAETKFGKIAELMDPSATALAQFTKSFDDLTNTLKSGIITGLTPILQFLTQNTFALTSALALFALPIIRAIVPAFGAWAEASKKTSRALSINNAKYKREMKENFQATRQAFADQEKITKAAQQRAKTIVGDKPSAGLDFLKGEGSGGKRQQAAAKKIIDNALQQTKEGKIAETGFLAGKNREQVLDLQRSYDARVKLAREGNKKIGLTMDTFKSAKKSGAAFFAAGWSKAFGVVVTGARIAALGINLAMNAVAIIGVVTLLIQAGKAVKDFFFPLEASVKAAKKDAEDLTDKYALLREELVRGTEARDNYVSGSQRVANFADQVAGADINRMIEDTQRLSVIAQKFGEDSSEYKEARKEITLVALELSKTDKRFARFATLLRETGTDAAKTAAQQLRNTANEVQRLGQAVKDLPRLVKNADSALKSLTSGLAKNTPLSTFVDAQDSLVKGLEQTRQAASKAGAEAFNQALEAGKLARLQEEEMTKFFGARGEARREELEALSDTNKEFRIRGKVIHQGMKDYREDYRFRKDGGEALLQLARESNDEEEELTTRREKATDLLNDARELEEKILNNQSKRVDKLTEQTKLQTLGLTIEGRLQNLGLERLKSEDALVKAKEQLSIAEFAVNNASEAEKATAKEKRDLAQKQVDLAQAQLDLATKQTDQKEKELNAERQLLALKQQQLVTELRSEAMGVAIRTEEATGGGTFASQQRLATLNQTQLENNVEQAKLNAIEAATEYDKIYQDKLNELRGIRSDKLKKEQDAVVLSDVQIAESAQQQAMVQTGGASVRTGIELIEAMDLLEVNKQKFNIFLKEGEARKENLDFQISGLSLLKSEEEVGKRILQLRKDGVFATDDQISAIRTQVQEEEDLERKLANMQGLRDNIEQGMSGAFESMITGAKSAKEAFADMAKSMLMYLAKIIAQEIALKALRAATSFFGLGFADGGISAAYGAVTPKKQYAGGGYTSPMRNYSRGGMARGPQQGYNAVLHGNEAVVPLPDNRHIPVEMTGGMGTQNNVTVNVNMEGEGGSRTSTQSNAPAAERMGQLIAKAVQDELQNQKRSGGILSPYGAA